MFLQTLVQLNILILATPALAGWIALPMAQSGMVQAACVVLQSRTAEAVAPKQTPDELVRRVQPARPLPAIPTQFALATAERSANLPTAFFVAPSAALASYQPFPHAIRAP